MSPQLETLLLTASAVASAKENKVARLASLLADAMKEIHGGEWRIDINHDPDAHFVLVVPKSRQRPAKPAPEVA